MWRTTVLSVVLVLFGLNLLNVFPESSKLCNYWSEFAQYENFCFNKQFQRRTRIETDNYINELDEILQILNELDEILQNLNTFLDRLTKI